MAAAGKDGIRIWDVADRKLSHLFWLKKQAECPFWDRTMNDIEKGNHLEAANCLDFSPDGSMLAVGKDGGKVALYRAMKTIDHLFPKNRERSVQRDQLSLQ